MFNLDDDDDAIAVLEAAETERLAQDEEPEPDEAPGEPETDPEPEPDAEPTEVETLAAGMGWAPESEWRGDPAKHVDAATFLKTGPEILRATLKKQDAQLGEMNTTLKGMAKAAKGVEERAYERAVKDLKTRQKEAVSDADTEEFERLDAEIDALEKPEPQGTAEKPAADAVANDPNFSLFSENNKWYGTDYAMSAYADQIAVHVGQKHQGAEFYEELSAAVKKNFPDAFRNTKRDRAPSVEEGASQSGRGAKGRSYADLPREAKTACDEFVDDGVLTKEAYVADYFAEETA
jgi:hypothetical protein